MRVSGEGLYSSSDAIFIYIYIYSPGICLSCWFFGRCFGLRLFQLIRTEKRVEEKIPDRQWRGKDGDENAVFPFPFPFPFFSFVLDPEFGNLV